MKTNRKPSLTVYCDGGSRGNPGPAAAGAVVEDKAGKKRLLCGKYLGRATNNQAEYSAVKLALEIIKENYPTKQVVEVYLDSLLAAQQLNGLYKVKNPGLQGIIFEIRPLESQIGEVFYQHIKREKNVKADSLVNRALDQKSGFFETQEI
jgi:ribonuclease HI